MDLPAMDARAARESEIDPLARLWYEGWIDAHGDIVPWDLQRLRSLEDLRESLRKSLPIVRVVGPPGSPLGFHIVRGAELHKLYVSRDSRGSGLAATLIADAEARLVDRGVETAWLACAIGNHRAARFYEKSGWHRVGTMIDETETVEGTFKLETWRYEKALTRQA